MIWLFSFLWSLTCTASSSCNDHSSFATALWSCFSGSTAGLQIWTETIVIAVTSDFNTWCGDSHTLQLEYCNLDAADGDPVILNKLCDSCCYHSYHAFAECSWQLFEAKSKIPCLGASLDWRLCCCGQCAASASGQHLCRRTGTHQWLLYQKHLCPVCKTG